jgi:parallel beta-helix repeat protein
MRSCAVASLVFLLLGAESLSARVIHVPGEYPTIQQGIDAAAGGDVVMVDPGRYIEEVTLKAGVIVQGSGAARCTIDGGGNTGDVVKATGNSIRNDCKFTGFTVTGAVSGGGMPGGAGIFCNSGASPEICNNLFQGNDFGIATWNSSNPSVHNNVVVHNNYFGIDISSRPTVVNNTIGFCQIGIDDGGGYAPTVMNNIVTACTRFGIYSLNPPPQLTYNDVWGNDSNYCGCFPGTGSISYDPQFTDTLAGDYRLQPGSACIDSGNPASPYNDPDGTRNDIGAYGGPGAETSMPIVTLTFPARNTVNALPGTDVSVLFSGAMDPTSFTPQAFRLLGSSSGVHAGLIAYDSSSRLATLNPGTDLWPGEQATAWLSHAVRARGGDSLPGYAWQFTTGTAAGSGSYQTSTAFGVDSGPNAIAVADFNLDGNPDIAVTCQYDNSLAVRLGDGAGGFGPVLSLPLDNIPTAIACAQFNPDSFPDLAVTHQNGTVHVLLGNGNGTFRDVFTCSAGLGPRGIAVADFNADGGLDLTIACATSNKVFTLFGQGDSSFVVADSFPCGSSPYGITANDFNNDGVPDLAVPNFTASTVSVLLGRPGGSFGPPAPFSTGTGPGAVCAGDYNADGNLDLATAGIGSNNISVLSGNGSGGFGSATNYRVAREPVAVLAADVNGDGALDLVSAGLSSDSISVLLGTGSGTFAAAVSYPAGGEPFGIAYGDFDHDDDLDIVVPDRADNDFRLLFNENALTVTSLNPGRNQLGVPPATPANAVFSAPLLASSISDTSFLVRGTFSGPHSGTLDYDSTTRTARFISNQGFLPGEPVTGFLTRSIRTPAGISLHGCVWDFTTAVTTLSNGTFGDPHNYYAGTEPRGVWAADFNHDRAVDLAVTCNSSGRICILLNDGLGGFPNTSYCPVNNDPIALFGADLDSDGDIDLAVFHNEPGSSHLEILTNNGSGTFTVTATYAPAILGQDVSGGDLDGDGDIDLVCTDGWGTGNNVHVMLNNGSGSFAGPFNYSAGSWARGVAVRDVDNDGYQDIVVADAGNNDVTVLYNRGDGTFPRLAGFPAGSSADGVVVQDLNDDGWADIATANPGGGDVSVLLNTGTGSFASPVNYAAGSGPRGLTSADCDGDNDIDLLVSLNNTDSVAVLLNQGDGTFAPAAHYPTGSTAWGIRSADFDNDGDMDFACVSYSTGNVIVWYNTGVAGLSSSASSQLPPELSVWPNPFRGRVRLQVTGLWSEPVRIFDAAGRLVRSLQLPDRGKRIADWDGTDQVGAQLPQGIYFVSLGSGPTALQEKLLKLQ